LCRELGVQYDQGQGLKNVSSIIAEIECIFTVR